MTPRMLAWRGALILGFTQSLAVAQIDARLILDTLLDSGSLKAPFVTPSTDRMSVVVELPPGVDARAHGLTPVNGRWATLESSPKTLQELTDHQKDWRLNWSPPRFTFLDQAAHWTRAKPVHHTGHITGNGVVVGIIDTGIDITHPDFIGPEGQTRIEWLIDFSRSPVGRHPELEQDFGCSSAMSSSCAIFDRNDLDELRLNDTDGDEPRDAVGHGTHVASLAAGNGAAHSPPRFVGVAPRASLIVARVTRGNDSAILDADILAGTRFVFERAAAMGRPAVVNLSLGSDFGPHDGTSPLERGLESFIGPDEPGRAIVVAAGNSGIVYSGLDQNYPDPLGIHTEVHVPRGSDVRVPLLTPPTAGGETNGKVLVWIGLSLGDELRVGLDDSSGRWIDPIGPGEGGQFERDQGKLTVTIFNDLVNEQSPLTGDSNGALVSLDGRWPSGETFAIRLAGRGTAELWLQSQGDIDPAGGSIGALFPRAIQQGTVSVPASHPALIAVGATLNRTTWRDRAQNQFELDLFGGVPAPPADSSVYFSSGGPSANGALKPDIVAPGAFLIGAMAQGTDPILGGSDFFNGVGVCQEITDCLVIDERYGIATGSSMAAPQVSGAVALLFERNPALVQHEIRALLQAGARKLEGTTSNEQQIGPGALDVEMSLAVQIAEPSLMPPSSADSWMALSSAYARPGSDRPLVGLVELRDQLGRSADFFNEKNVRLIAEPANVVEPLSRIAPGLWGFSVSALTGTGGGDLRLSLLYEDEEIIVRKIPIAVDIAAAREGAAAQGGCAMASSRQVPVEAWGWALFALMLIRRKNWDSNLS